MGWITFASYDGLHRPCTGASAEVPLCRERRRGRGKRCIQGFRPIRKIATIHLCS